MTTSTFLDALLNKLIQSGGLPLPPRKALNFLGFKVTDNEANDSTDVSGAAGTWQTVLDLDFSTLPNQTLGTDGPVTLAGLSWKKFNSAQETAPTAIVHGSGLVFRPATGAQYISDGGTPSNRTAPILALPLASVIPHFDNMTQVRVWFRLTDSGLGFTGGSIQSGFAGIENTGGAIQMMALMERGQDVYGADWQERMTQTGYQVAANFGYPAGYTRTVGLMWFPNGVYSLTAIVTNGPWGAGTWPLPNQLFPEAMLQYTGITEQVQQNQLGGFDAAGPAFIVGANNMSGADVPVFTIQNVRIDCK